MSRTSWNPGSWPDRRFGRARVLIEESDGAGQWATANHLQAAGYEVAVCDGPDGHDAACPLAARGECALADGADVIVNSFRLAEPANQDVIRALRGHVPTTPVLVEAGPQERSRYVDVLEGCIVANLPLTRRSLLQHVEEALDEERELPGGAVR